MPDSTPATPAVVIDLATVQRNIARLAADARTHGLKVRPHTKTHKSLRMARLQIDAGAAGLAVAKVDEALVMVDASDDLLVAYPVVDGLRARRVAELARRATLRVAVDSSTAIDVLSAAAAEAGSTVGILVDLDVGFHRTGVQTPAESLDLARQVADKSHLRLDGLFFYPGHVISSGPRQADELAAVDAVIAEAIGLWRRHGLAAPIVSGGSTPTAYQAYRIAHQTEIRPGTYLYNDMNTVRGGFCTLDDCAARVVCTVISISVPGKCVIDAGTKALTSDRNWHLPDSGFGHVVEYPAATIVRLSEEHGELDLSACDRHPKVGDRVTVIPNHICPCINLFDFAWLREADGSLHRLPIDARGKLG